MGGQQLVRLNEKVIGEVSKDHGINATEMGILLFLSGNPSLDTAKDIVENRMMTKSSVSRAVDSLVRQGYIRTREDAFDRRITHLVLEEKADPVIELGMQAQEEVFLSQPRHF
ncbi:MAG: MarR family winged helix-turn-helix transcriptional regulator [Blautia sp.]